MGQPPHGSGCERAMPFGVANFATLGLRADCAFGGPLLTPAFRSLAFRRSKPKRQSHAGARRRGDASCAPRKRAGVTDKQKTANTYRECRNDQAA